MPLKEMGFSKKTAVLVTFSVNTSKFDSNSDRNKFFKNLYGWEQTVPTETKEYHYHRKGILDTMPHSRVDQSSFIVPDANFDEVISFFEQWTNKIIWKTFKVLLEKDEMDEMFEEAE